MTQVTKQSADKCVKEHLSICLSLMVFLLLLLSGKLSFSLQVMISVGLAMGVAYNHFTCRKLGAAIKGGTRD